MFNSYKERGCRVERVTDYQIINNGIHIDFGSERTVDIDKLKSYDSLDCKLQEILIWKEL